MRAMIPPDSSQFSPDHNLGLYVHLPWCIRKCPYCDFNSHRSPAQLPEQAYVAALLQDLEQALAQGIHAPIHSIFIGGGTPSLFSAAAISELLAGIAARTALAADVEITLEANPGTTDKAHFAGYLRAGVNRLSLGIQSFDDAALQALGRIHDKTAAIKAITQAQDCGFERINLDIMYALPQQSLNAALADLAQAAAFSPQHLSWYQLTIEPNTWFYQHPPVCPDDDLAWEMQLQGQAYLAEQGFSQYEISAYAKAGEQCRHNRNYWLFGDYIGIGAGAHGKYTDANGAVWRYQKPRKPEAYLQNSSGSFQRLSAKDLQLEFMLNTLRLRDGFACAYYKARTGLDWANLESALSEAQAQKWITQTQDWLYINPNGQQFLNDLLLLFYEE